MSLAIQVNLTYPVCRLGSRRARMGPPVTRHLPHSVCVIHTEHGRLCEGCQGEWEVGKGDPKEAVPEVTHVALLHHPSTMLGTGYGKDIPMAAQALGLTLQSFAVREPGELEGAFVRMTEQRSGALIVATSAFLHTHQSRVIALAAQHRLPAIYGFRNFVDAGGLMSYGISIADLWRRAATYVDKLLKGTKPPDLPVEQPLKFELVINLKTAKALGMTMPPSLLLLADEVIQ